MASVTRRARNDVDVALNMEERLQQALERLLDRGLTITAISVDALSREAGIARATFYLHFRDKGELVARLIARVADEVVGAGGLWFVHAEDARFEDLRAAMARFFDAYLEHHAILAAAAETAPYDRQVANLHTRMLERFVAESRQAVQRIAASGRAHPGLPPMVAEVLSWSVNHTYVQYGKGLDDAQRQAFIDTWSHVVWHSIFAPDK
ncbi:MAG: TetR/AcrR family transcriptional regulator [Gammaproteobacteria bacterium]|nr:TetR/AcrR family transcriptional regulator [Gammaproteobacteria bacterium]